MINFFFQQMKGTQSFHIYILHADNISLILFSSDLYYIESPQHTFLKQDKTKQNIDFFPLYDINK